MNDAFTEVSVTAVVLKFYFDKKFNAKICIKYFMLPEKLRVK